MFLKKLVKNNYHHILEAILFGGIAMVINIFFFKESPLFRGYPLNPYLILPVLLSLRYGSICGFFDFLITSSFALYACHHLNNFDYVIQEGWIFILGVMFICQLSGQLSDAFRNQLEFLKERCIKVEDDLDKAVKNNMILVDANRALSKKIISRFDSLNTVYESAKTLETLNEEELYPSSLEILKNQIMVKSASIYMLKDEKFYLKEYFDLEFPVNRSEILDLNSEMVKQAYESNKQVSYLPYLEGRETSLPSSENGIFLAVTPISIKNMVAGFIIIENINFMDFSRSALRMINMVTDWISSALERINAYENIKSQVPDDPELFGYKAEYMKNQLANEVSKAVRYNLPLSVLCVKVIDIEEMTVDSLNNISSVIGFVFKNYKRQIDLFGSTAYKAVFMLILPVTDRKGMDLFFERVIKEINNFNFKPYKDQSRPLDLDVFKVSLDDLIDRSKLATLPKGSINSEANKLMDSILEVLQLTD